MSLLSQASLVMTPNAIKESKIYSIIPTNGNGDADFTRDTLASSTLSGANGLIELVPYNLLRYSEMFTDNSWNKLLGSTVIANTTVSPNGTLTADTLNFNGTAFGQIAQNIPKNIGETYTFSIWIKSNLSTSIDLYIGSDSSTINTVTSSWQLFSITKTITTAFASPKLVSSLVGSFDIWGAQLVQGSIPKDYFFTTDRLNVPRLNYESYGGCPSILLEPQRTNLSTNSGTLTGFGTFGISLSSALLNNPENGINSVLMTENTDNSAHFTFGPAVISYTSGILYTNSIFVKKGNGSNAPNIVQLTFSSGAFGTSQYANFNILTGVITAQVGGTATIKSYPNGWYRISFSAQCTVTSTNTSGVTVFFTNNNPTATRGSIYVGNINSNVFIWGAQLEQGAYPTSYIPTTTIPLTRNGDIFTRNNLYANGIITDIGGTWFLEINNNLSLIRDANLPSGISLDRNPAFFDDGFLIRNNFNGTSVRLGIEIRQGGSIVGTYSTLENTVKIAIKWDGTVAIVYVNGVVRIDFVAFTTKIMNYLSAKADDVPKYIKSMLFFPLPLSNSEMVALTSSTNYISYENMAINLNYVIQ
jgi:hypothetical protein